VSAREEVWIVGVDRTPTVGEPPAPMGLPPGCVGIVLVFGSRQVAQAAYPDKRPLRMFAEVEGDQVVEARGWLARLVAAWRRLRGVRHG